MGGVEVIGIGFCFQRVQPDHLAGICVEKRAVGLEIDAGVVGGDFPVKVHEAR